MGHIGRIGLIISIIVLLPLVALAHEGEVHFGVDPTILPGQRGYTWERVSEWISVNLFTLSTKRKQEKKLKFSEERLAEFMALMALGEDTRGALGRYRDTLFDAGDMARKIVIIDGAEIAVAEKFEDTTRLHETVLVELLQAVAGQQRGPVSEAITAARLANEDMFLFMARNYQFNEADIDKHRKILGEHIAIVERISNAPQPPLKLRGGEGVLFKKASELLIEAKKHQAAGLNVEGYELVKKAKDVVYGRNFK